MRPGPILNENVKVEQEEESNSSISDLFKRRERPAPPAKEGKNFKGRKQAAERDDKETADHDEKATIHHGFIRTETRRRTGKDEGLHSSARGNS